MNKLTQRTCSKNRRIFSDFVISCPKSVSLLGLMVYERIVQLHNKCILLALEEVESFAAARVRAGGENTHRTTKNLLVRLFHHDTSRALDPMIHSHCVIFNVTHDSVENKWKALEKVEMLRIIRYINSVYEHELCRGLRKLEYQIEVEEHGQFEIAGLTRDLIEKFSKRHTEIVQKAQIHLQEKGLTARNLSALSKQVRLDTRPRKAPLQKPQKLKNLWEDQLTEAEKQILENAYAYTKKPVERTLPADAQQAITFAKNYWFERNTTAQDYELWALALECYRSEDFSVKALKSEFQKLEFLQSSQDQREVTTEEVLETEAFLVKTTQEGIGQWKAIGVVKRAHNETNLSSEQQRAIESILNSRDFVTLFRGAAGTDKSHTLGTLKAILKDSGHTLHVCTPQTQQVQDLQKDGFGQA